MQAAVRKGARVALVTAVVGTLTLGAFGFQGANADLASFAGNATGYALRVTIDLTGLPQAAKAQVDTAWATAYNALPAEVKATVPSSFPYTIDQYFLKSTSDASGTVTKAVSILSDGTVPAQADWVVTADAPGQDKSVSKSTTDILKNVDAGVINIAPITATAAALKASVAAGPRVDGNNTLAQVTATLEAITGLLPADVQTAFAGALATVNATINDAAATFNTTLNSAADAAGTAIAGTPLGSTLAGAGVNLTDLSGALNLPTNLQLPNALTMPTLATLTDVTSKATAARAGDVVSSDSSSSIKSASILNGFISSSLINLASHSEATGVAGSAKNTSSCTLADLRVGGNNGVAFDGTNVYVNGTAVPVPSDQVAAVKTQVGALLAQAGVTVNTCSAADAKANADGSSASQSVSAFEVIFEPRVPDASAIAALTGTPTPAEVNTALANLGLTAGQPLGVKVVIDPTVSTSVSAAPVTTAPVTLPRTGPQAAATAIAGLGLMGGGLALRRRMR